MFLKSYSIDDNHKTTHKKILLNIFVVFVWYLSFISSVGVLYIYLVRMKFTHMNSKTMNSCNFLINVVPKMYLKVFEKYLKYFCKVFAFEGNQKYLHLHLKKQYLHLHTSKSF